MDRAGKVLSHHGDLPSLSLTAGALYAGLVSLSAAMFFIVLGLTAAFIVFSGLAAVATLALLAVANLPPGEKLVRPALLTARRGLSGRDWRGRAESMQKFGRPVSTTDYPSGRSGLGLQGEQSLNAVAHCQIGLHSHRFQTTRIVSRVSY